MGTEQSDQVERYRLKTQFLQNCVRHTMHSDNHADAGEKLEDWENREELGRGGFSFVFKQREINTGRYRAVKTIDKRRLPPSVDYFSELMVMADLAKHTSLFMQFLGWFEGSDTLCIAMEYIELGDLRKHIGKPLPQKTVQQITNQLLEGLKVMHEKGIAHRDVKPEVESPSSQHPPKVSPVGGVKLTEKYRTSLLFPCCPSRSSWEISAYQSESGHKTSRHTTLSYLLDPIQPRRSQEWTTIARPRYTQKPSIFGRLGV
ncbi:kinase-like domain-containing protein [Tuber brumale]|nr:kinase-like domain-containing protein [Tuber brumale]